MRISEGQVALCGCPEWREGGQTLSQGQCLKKNTAASHRHPKFQSTRRMTTLILKGDLDGTEQRQIRQPWEGKCRLAHLLKKSSSQGMGEKTRQNLLLAHKPRNPPLSSKLLLLFKDLNRHLRYLFMALFCVLDPGKVSHIHTVLGTPVSIATAPASSDRVSLHQLTSPQAMSSWGLYHCP